MVRLNIHPDHDFDEPLGVLSDCHRRVTWFLDVIHSVAAQARGHRLTGPQRDGLVAAVRYFRVAAPKHTADEEVSLFPRLRASSDPRAAEVLAKIDALEADHARAEALHGEAEELVNRWLSEGRLGPEAADRLLAIASELVQTYERHIAVEDNEVFPLAGQILEAEDLRRVGAEMAERRGLTDRASALLAQQYRSN